MRNLVLIFIDTLRADRLGCYGHGRATSPALDALAARSLVLDACWSTSNFTAPAFTSIFTGAYPHRHGVFDFLRRADRSPINEALAAAGYRTGGVVTFRFFPRLLERIWGPIEVVTQTRSFSYSKDLPRAVTAGAVAWLRQQVGQGPFCLFLHYDGPHAPYRLPDEYAGLFGPLDGAGVDPEIADILFPQDRERLQGEGRGGAKPRMFQLIKQLNYGRRRANEATRQWLGDRYDESVRYNDDVIGSLLGELEGLGLAADTIVGVFSDHGEELFDHGHFSHAGIHLYEEVVRTVGIIHDPADPRPRRLERPVSHVQLLPTLLRLAGVPVDETLASLAIDEQRAELSPVYCQGEFKSAVRLGRHKLIQALPAMNLPWHRRLRLWLRMLQAGELREEMYDLRDDPGERRNLAARGRSTAEPRVALRRTLAAHLAGIGPMPGGEAAAAAERDRIEQELRDLGYM
jgi:arylsulfatase